jgi:hypothetical protein
LKTSRATNGNFHKPEQYTRHGLTSSIVCRNDITGVRETTCRKVIEMTTRPAGHQPSLNGLDRQVIAQAASMLPGNWYLDPVIDLQHSGRPRVWIRSSAFPKCNGLAVSFERRGMSVWMALQDPAMDPSNIVEDLPFDTVLAAFI